MADQPGFFDQLVGSPQDETALADQVTRARVDDTRTRSAAMAERGGTQIAESLFGLFGKKDKAQQLRDNHTASVLGLRPEEVKSRRRIRQETASVKDDGSFAARRKMAEVAARIANEEGDAAGLSRALQAMQSLKVEEAEWNKLQSNTKSAEAKATEDQISDGYTSDGTPLSGVRGIKDGAAGLWVTMNGKLTFKPFDEGFSQIDPATQAKNEDLAVRLSRISSKEERSKIRAMSTNAMMGVRKTDRILSTLTDLYNEGGVGSVIGWSGGLISTIDNLSRNINGIISAFSTTREGATRDAKNKSRWIQEATEGADWVTEFIQLPPGVEATSAAAQQHRANVMEMAYMAARLAEPSNRGLSDNDIKNALIRIAGDTSNPQVMLRKFIEMQADAAHELDHMLSGFHGALGPDVSDEDLDKTLAGDGYRQYKEAKDILFEKYGAVEGDDGRVTFSELIGTDVQPGEGTGAEPPAPVDVLNMSNEDAAKALGL